MRYALIENGVVKNIVVADADYAAKQGWVAEVKGCAIGGTHDGVKFTPPPPDLDKLATEARQKRDYLLAQSDWTQMPDAPVDRTAWAAYRQALRDVPQQPGFPENIVWPSTP